MKNIELLAPAGNAENLIIAINNGANAVYLGLKGFNARSKAENFTEKNIRTYVKLAHLYGVKVYVTVNTLIKDSELNEIIHLVNVAANAKVDAFLVQDLGLLKILKQCFKNINLHASTQMGVHNKYGAIVAQNLGCSRVVLSRESTKQDIIDIKQSSNLEVEYFVQGALCVAFSGNCYYSSLCFSESGNRGKCLQPCRLPYTASINNQNLASGYLISTNDLNYISRLSEIEKAGVDSLKIEGRMRRGAYVAQAVDSYNKVLKQKGNEACETQKLERVFSRGKFNTGYYFDNNISKNIINTNYQNHRGVKVGSVVKCEKFKDLNKITIKVNNYTPSCGDGLKFVFNGVECSMGVGNSNKIANNIFEVFSKTKTQSGAEVFLTLDNLNEQKLLSKSLKLPINAHFVSKTNKKAVLTLSYNNICCSVESPDVCAAAKNSPATQQQIYDSVNRFNDTNFELSNFDCELENVFIPKSVINEMRRSAVLMLEEKIIANFESNCPNVIFNADEYNKLLNSKAKFAHKTYYIVDDKQTYMVPSSANVVLAPTVFNKQSIDKLMEQYKNHKLFVMLPLVVRSNDLDVVDMVVNSLNKNVGLVANNIYGLYYLSLGYNVVANYPLNVTNNITAFALNQLGVSDVVKSIESDLSVQVNNCLTYSGYPSLMTFTHCPYKTTFNYDDCKNCKFKPGLDYTNERGHKFNIRRTKVSNCYFDLINDIKIENNNATMIDLRGNN